MIEMADFLLIRIVGSSSKDSPDQEQCTMDFVEPKSNIY